MTTQLRLFLRFGLALAIAVTAANAASSTKKSDKKLAAPAVATPNPKPELRLDASPLEPKAGLVVSYADIVEPMQKAVVSIYSTKMVHERLNNPLLRQFGFPDQERESKLEGLGSGVIVSPDGYILTNNHVVEGADELKVSLADDREFIAKIIGTDPKTDIAVVKIDADHLPVATLADSDKLRVGDVVFAIGNPLAVGQTVTMGIVSAKSRSLPDFGGDVSYQDFIQTDAAINMGNSGGALIDAKGRLIGVNSAILSPSRGNIGIGFAIPINLAAWIMNSLIETGTVARGYLGISTDNLTPDVAEQLGLPKDSHGVVITDIVPGTAAEKAGLKLTDAILAVNDHAIATQEQLRLLIAQMAPGSPARLKVVREGKERMVDVTLDRFAEKPNELLDGVNVRALSNDDRRRLNLTNRVTGLIITEVAEDSPLREDLFPDMIIMQVNRTPVSDLAGAKELVQPGRNLLQVFYRGVPRYLVVGVK